MKYIGGACCCGGGKVACGMYEDSIMAGAVDAGVAGICMEELAACTPAYALLCEGSARPEDGSLPSISIA